MAEVEEGQLGMGIDRRRAAFLSWSKWLSTHGHLAAVIGQVLVAIALGVWAMFNWWNGQQQLAESRRIDAARQAEVRSFEARKPFLEKQLALHFETASVVGKLVTTDPQSDAWRSAHDRFWALFYTELKLVTNENVDLGMILFAAELRKYARNSSNKEKLQEDAQPLIHAIRGMVDETWSARALSQLHKTRARLKTMAGWGETSTTQGK